MEHRPGTRVVHAGLPGAEQGQPFLPGPEFAGPYHLAGDPHTTPYNYGRYGNRTVGLYESAIAELEGGETVVFASGMAACSAVLLGLCDPGSTVVLPSDGYPMVRKLAAGRFDVRLVPTAAAPGDDLGGARVVWLETPSNPGLDVCDIGPAATAAHEAGAIVVVDNTLATPLGQRPLEHGADISVGSGTKALTGHSDLLIGYVSCADPDLAGRIREWRSMTGGIPGPFEAWLAHRSLATLDVRLERQCGTAAAVAAALAARDDVDDVRYPGLGMVVCFDLGSEERAQGFFAASGIVTESTSFGGIHTMGERRARWDQGDEVSEGFIRLSIGIEDRGDVLADIDASLDACRPG